MENPDSDRPSDDEPPPAKGFLEANEADGEWPGRHEREDKNLLPATLSIFDQRRSFTNRFSSPSSGSLSVSHGRWENAETQIKKKKNNKKNKFDMDQLNDDVLWNLTISQPTVSGLQTPLAGPDLGPLRKY